jgi:hypothetical protein
LRAMVSPSPARRLLAVFPDTWISNVCAGRQAAWRM